jgi:hypothetical protein
VYLLPKIVRAQVDRQASSLESRADHAPPQIGDAMVYDLAGLARPPARAGPPTHWDRAGGCHAPSPTRLL